MISGLMKNLGITQFSSSKKVVGEASRVKKTPQKNETAANSKTLEQDTFTANKKTDTAVISIGDKFEKSTSKR